MSGAQGAGHKARRARQKRCGASASEPAQSKEIAVLTPKENYLAVLNHEKPDFVPDVALDISIWSTS